MATILVTGAAGFIGSHFALRHRERFPADQLIVLDKLTYAADKALLEPIMPQITFVEGDITDRELVGKLINEYNIDTIVNFAAETHVDRSISDASPFLHTNVLGTQSLIEAVRAKPQVLLMHISTDEVYGDLRDDDLPKIPTDSLKPSSPYSASKAAADLLVLAAVRTYGIRARISRCTNNYGPHQVAEKFLPTVIRCALADQPIPVYAQGKNMRDWLYVTDHTDAVELLLQKGKDGVVYHVSAGSERRNIDVAKAILRLMDKPETLLTFVEDRPGHDWRYALNSTDTRALGWAPAIDFEDGLKRTVEWYSRRSFVR